MVVFKKHSGMHEMDDSSDIANLFKHFDGDPVDYQEFMLSSDALHAKSRWPLIAAIDPAAAVSPASVVREQVVSMSAPSASFAIPTATPVETAPVAEKPATRAQFMAPQAKVLSAVRRGRDPAVIDMEAARAATHNALPDETSADADIAGALLPAAAPKPKRIRTRKPALSTTPPDQGIAPVDQIEPAAPPVEAAAELPLEEARFVAPKPKVLSGGPTRRGHKPAVSNTEGDASATAPAPADSTVEPEQNGHHAGNGAVRPHATDTPPFLFKRL
jgi:hypothetical protein